MANLTFPCSHCKKLMAAGEGLAGKKVRCPHCQGVVPVPTDSSVKLAEGAANPAWTQVVGSTDNPFEKGPSYQESVLPTEALPAMGRADELGGIRSSGAEGLTSPDAISNPSYRAASRGPKQTRNASGLDSFASLLLWILVPYSLLMTGVSIYYYMKFETSKSVHPLEMIPDLLGEFKNKQGKGSTAQSLRLPSPDIKLPEQLITDIGKPIAIGDIEVTPLKVTQGPTVAFSKEKDKDEPEKRYSPSENLVLHLQLKNLSNTMAFYPSDPYFVRRPKSPNDRPYSMVEVDGKKFYGGLVEYVTEHGRIEREWAAGQESDHLPLGPGETRETVIVTHPKDGVIAALNAAKSQSIWRVHIRRGLVPFRSTEVPVSCVVGVKFSAKDVKKEA